jgi:hypothetical protein
MGDREDVPCYDMIPYTKDLGYTNLSHSTETHLPCDISNLARLLKKVKPFAGVCRLSIALPLLDRSFGFSADPGEEVILGASAAPLFHPLNYKDEYLLRRVHLD